MIFGTSEILCVFTLESSARGKESEKWSNKINLSEALNMLRTCRSTLNRYFIKVFRLLKTCRTHSSHFDHKKKDTFTKGKTCPKVLSPDVNTAGILEIENKILLAKNVVS